MTTIDPYDAARDAVMADSESWMPHKNAEQSPVLVGVLVHEGVTPDAGYGPAAVATLRDRDGKEWTVRMFGSVLAREWEEAGASLGDVVAIRYVGKQQTKDGTEFRLWRVRVMRTGEVLGLTEQQAQQLERAEELTRDPEVGHEPLPLATDDDETPF